MKARPIAAGEELITRERALDRRFCVGGMNAETLAVLTARMARARGNSELHLSITDPAEVLFSSNASGMRSYADTASPHSPVPNHAIQLSLIISFADGRPPCPPSYLRSKASTSSRRRRSMTTAGSIRQHRQSRRFLIRCGSQGITILGVMGEYQKLSESETIEVAQRFIKRAAGRLPIVVGVSNPGTYPLVKTARAVMEMGAGRRHGDANAGRRGSGGRKLHALDPHRARTVDPVCVQDYPKLTGAISPPITFPRLVDAFRRSPCSSTRTCPAFKAVGDKQCRNGKSGRRYVSILCGNGGIHLPQEYLRGADGAMTGFAFPDMMVRMHALFAAGKPEEGEDLYDLYLPLMRHELQPGVGLPIRKEILRRRGAIRSAAIRAPGPKLDATDMAELDRLLARLAKKTGLGLNDFEKA